MRTPGALPARVSWLRGAAGLFLFGGLGLIFLFGAGVLGVSGPATARLWLGAVRGPWALPMVVAAFAALAFLGVPQFVLIAAAVAAFGPGKGVAYSWVGTLVSALVGFSLARAFRARGTGAGRAGAGQGAQGGLPGLAPAGMAETVSRLMVLIGRNGFLACLVIRLVPFAPFLLVNMAAGLTTISLLEFTLGTALGILPKIVLTAAAGHSIARAASGGAGWLAIGLLALAVALWIAATLAARRWLKP